MDYGYVSVAFEVVEIKSKNFTYLMNGHGCDQAGIVDLESGHSILSHEFAPSRGKFRSLWQ